MAGRLKRFTGKRFNTVLLIIALLAVIIMTGIIIAGFLKNMTGREEIGAATGKSALESFKDIAGESYIETLGDIKEAKNSSDPVKYLVENSVYILDEEAIEVYVESYITAAESTAQATGVTVDELIVGDWGYESIDAYRKEAKEFAITFIKERLAVYEAADAMNMKLTENEYEEQLSLYAVKFGYATSVEFEYGCTPASIANEMLYDKMVAGLTTG